jgi:tetratricopeptide (TPR) repeat protein
VTHVRPASGASRPSDPLFGGRFQLHEELGRGGFATVYRAWDAARQVEVALKVLERKAERDLARFAREGQALARLRHPNIVAVHEAGVAEGRPFLVEELVVGKDLAALAQPRGLPPGTAALILRDVAEAIDHAHEQGVLHRDLKPENVVVDARGRPRVVDFGLAALTDASGPALTTPGTVMGTPGFVAPELLAGAPASPASDIYALGATLHEALCGRAPFHDMDDTLTAPLRVAPTPPSEQAPATPPALDAIVLRCLARTPDARYPTARALARALDAFLDAAPQRVPARADPRRRAAITGATVAVGVAGLVAVAVMASSSPPPPPAPVTAPPPVAAVTPVETPATRLAALLAAPAIDHAAVRALLSVSGHDPAVVVVARDGSRALLERAWALAHAGGPFSEEVVELMRLAADLGASDADLQARAQLAMADYLLRRGRHDRALDAAQLVPPSSPSGLAARLMAAGALRSLGRKAEATAALSAIAADDPDGPSGLVAQAVQPFDAWDYASSSALAERALALDPDHRRALTILATGLAFRGGGRRALTALERGLAAAPDDAQLHLCAGLAHMNLRETEPAIDAFSRAIALVAPEPYLLATKWRGITLLKAGRNGEALLDLEAATRLRPDDADLLIHRGLALWGNGFEERAAADWRAAYEVDAAFVRRRLGDVSPDMRQRIIDAIQRPGGR